MVGLAAGLLASAALAFTLFLWLLVYGREDRTSDFAAFADARGWDHRAHPPEHRVRLFEMIPEGKVDRNAQGPYFAGPTACGPFQAVGMQPASARKRPGKGNWDGDRLGVHIRTATESPGMTFRPRTKFVVAPKPDDVQMHQAIGHEAFDRRFEVACPDPTFVAQALDYETCALLLKPERGMIGSWHGHDLMFLFPLRPRTMAGYETLLRYAVAVTRRLERYDGHGLPSRRRPAPTGQPAPNAAQTPATA